jgi:hypothetical protein
MKHEAALSLLHDFFNSRSETGDPELTAVEAALFVEDYFGVRLTDDNISMENFYRPEAVLRLVEEKRG